MLKDLEGSNIPKQDLINLKNLTQKFSPFFSSFKRKKFYSKSQFFVVPFKVTIKKKTKKMFTGIFTTYQY